ncbi:TadE/TadG family type IV pilus assembly protein [Stutzerimonas nitrititolerans]|uniref:TadE/TadG family type IV pilus assembly protein n=1 Tax=Stutzerimonas nitrititolerans TaxID=2482751 RepID=UPI0015E36E55|nr:TadE family protein [Stutzerimonas nitrititolerans]MBA1185926.1 pilus assembly protein [Stutzerimonas stutzeri]
MKRRAQCAQAMVEFLIIIPVLVLLIFGAVQAAFIYSAKTGLNYATFQAARIGAVNNAQYADMRRGLLRGMYPMFSQIEDPQRRMEHTAREVDNFVLITRVSPDSAAFNAWAEEHDDLLEDGEAAPAIPNDNLMYRPMQQNPVSIQDANLLKIRTQYCMRLIVPIVDRLLSSGSRFVDRGRASKASASFRDVSRATSADYDDVCRGRPGFVVSSEATLRMQSPAVNDEEQCASGGRMICP